jgi:hypothetical protein
MLGDFGAGNGMRSIYCESLTSVGGLQIVAAVNIDSLLGLDSLVETTGPGCLIIASNRMLRNLDGLDSLTRHRGCIIIRGNEHLNEIDALSGLSEVGGIEVSDNRTLDNLDGFSGLVTVNGDFVLRDNTYLTDIEGLATLTSLAGDLVVEDQPWLATCEVEALVLRLRVEGWVGAATISGTDDTVSCE